MLESIVEGFQSHMAGLFELFGRLLVDPESIEVRITTVRYDDLNFIIAQSKWFIYRSLGVIAQYIDSDDKAELVSNVCRSLDASNVFAEIIPGPASCHDPGYRPGC